MHLAPRHDCHYPKTPQLSSLVQVFIEIIGPAFRSWVGGSNARCSCEGTIQLKVVLEKLAKLLEKCACKYLEA